MWIKLSTTLDYTFLGPEELLKLAITLASSIRLFFSLSFLLILSLKFVKINQSKSNN